MKIDKVLLLAAWLGLGGIGFVGSSASALPKNGLDPALALETDAGRGAENAGWICGPYGDCRWVPSAPYWGWGPPRPYWSRYFQDRPWWWRNYW